MYSQLRRCCSHQQRQKTDDHGGTHGRGDRRLGRALKLFDLATERRAVAIKLRARSCELRLRFGLCRPRLFGELV
jgi:hypothetical protein